MKSIMVFTKKTPNLVNLIASIVSNDSYGVKNYNCWSYYQYMRSGKSINSKTVKVGPCMCKLCLFEPTCVSLGLTFVLPISKYVKCVIRPIQCTHCPFKLRCTSMVLQAILLIHLKKNQRFILLMWLSRPSLLPSKLSHCGLLYFHLLYNILDYFH